MTTPKYPNVKVKLVGKDSNAFNILGICLRQARSAGLTELQIKEFTAQATGGDYDHLLNICQEWFSVC